MISRQLAAQLSDERVLAETKRLACCEQSATADLVTMLAELDSRKLYFAAGFNSLFAYCTDELHLSEDAAYTRIEVARISRIFPLVLELVRECSLSLTNARLLIPVLTPDNHVEVLEAAKHQRKKHVGAFGVGNSSNTSGGCAFGLRAIQGSVPGRPGDT